MTAAAEPAPPRRFSEHVRLIALAVVLVAAAASFLPDANQFALRLMLGGAVGLAVGFLPSAVLRNPELPARTAIRVGLSVVVTVAVPLLLMLAHQDFAWGPPAAVGGVFTVLTVTLYVVFYWRVRRHITRRRAELLALQQLSDDNQPPVQDNS